MGGGVWQNGKGILRKICKNALETVHWQRKGKYCKKLLKSAVFQVYSAIVLQMGERDV